MRQFADIIRFLSGGTCYDQLSEKLAELARSVIETRKQGSLTLVITLKPNGANSLKASGAVRLKTAEAAVGDTIFFTDEEGNLMREDPRQKKLPLQEAAAQPKEAQVG